MTDTRWIGAVVALLLTIVPARAAGLRDRDALRRVNARLHGRVIDHTHNHGADNRIWSPALRQLRDLYVYLPPGFDPGQRYPVILFFHGIIRDEQMFLHHIAELIDRAIVAGKLPPVLVAAPDGSIRGGSCLFNGASFFVNSRAGNFEDYLVHDVWDFLVKNYPLCPEREAHVLFGDSMGGAAAFNLAIKHRDCFHVAIGIAPPLNSRWVDCHGHYRSKFDPDCWGWRTELRPHETIGRFAGGLINISFKCFTDALYGRGPDALAALSRENPVEMLERFDVREGQLALYVAYGGKDELNITAQVDSFLHVARQRGLTVAVEYDPNGRHDLALTFEAIPGIVAWLAPRLTPFSPPHPLPGAATPPGPLPGAETTGNYP